MDVTFTLSIEPLIGKAHQYGFHLGTDERVARQFAEEVYRRLAVRHEVRTVALMRKGRVYDVFDGVWFNDTSHAFLSGGPLSDSEAHKEGV